MIVLGTVLGALVGVGGYVVVAPAAGRRARQFAGHLLSKLRRSADDNVSRRHAADLAIVDWTPTDLVVRQLIGVLIGAIGSAIVLSPVLDGLSVVAMSVAGGAVGLLLPAQMMRRTARSRRRSVLHAFSAFLDLVNVLLAGGAGIETALVASAEAGDGWVFEHLRACLVRARLRRRSPWHELRSLGIRWGIPELVEVAGSMSLSGEHGARIRTSLAARADSMRARQVAEIEAIAQSATERMGLPVMLLFVGFMVLLGYPALQEVVMNM